MLLNHLKFHRVLQVGILVALSLTEVCDVLLGTLGSRWIGFFLEEKQGAQTQILFSRPNQFERFRFFLELISRFEFDFRRSGKFF